MCETSELVGGVHPAKQMDTGVRAQDDLFRHVNGAWIAQHTIPSDRGRDGAFTALRDLSEERVREIIENADPASGHEAKLIHTTYSAYMDTQRLEQLGTSPLQPRLAQLRETTSHAQLAHHMGYLAMRGVAGLLGFGVENDFNDPTRYALFVGQSGLGLPDESYYREAAHAQTLADYRLHIEQMFQLTDVYDATTAGRAADAVVKIETKIAALHWDKVRCREADQTNNPMSYAQLAQSAPGFEWDEYLRGLDGPEGFTDSLIVMQPSYFTQVAQLWRETDLETWKMWLEWHLTLSVMPYLTPEISRANFGFYGTKLTGAPEQRERWKRGVSMVESVLGEAVGKQYVEKYFPATHKQAMDALVDKLLEAYRISIENLEWMGQATRERALAKLRAFTPKIGYPDRWRDYSGLELPQGDLLGCVAAATAFYTAWELGKLRGPVDKNEWFMTPQTVNAYYHPMMNEIVFPAAILQPPFFDPKVDAAWNYGAIGAVIGHEIGHGFDDQGSKFDGEGALNDWWTPEDREEFEARTRALIEQYDAYVPREVEGGEHRVNGALTIGENIGDLGGLSIALKAYELHLAQEGFESLEAAPVIGGLGAAQRFFYSWARAWQQKSRREETIRLLSIDPHSPNEFRCNGVVSNMDAFVEAFGVKPGDGLWREPAQRVSIW